MNKINWKAVVGLGGVSTTERQVVQQVGSIFDRMMLVVVLLIPFQWYIEQTGHLEFVSITLLDWVIWLFFALETTIMVSISRDKIAYLANNWLNLIIIVFGLPFFWVDTPLIVLARALRWLVVIGVLVNRFAALRSLLSRNHLGITLSVAVIIVLLAGVLIVAIDPAIGNITDGIWWALVTITTVGYGDTVPVSIEGRIFASVLIVAGVVLFSLLTANISAFLIDQHTDEDDEIIADALDALEQRIEKMENILNQIHLKLEDKESQKTDK